MQQKHLNLLPQEYYILNKSEWNRKKQPLSLFLSFDRNTYFMDSVIKYKIELMNISDYDVIVDNRFVHTHHIEWYIFDPLHHRVLISDIAIDPPKAKKEDFICLRPGFTYGEIDTIDLSQCRGFSIPGQYQFYVLFYVPKYSTYDLADLEMGKKINFKDWRGRLFSNIVSVNIFPVPIPKN